MTARATTADLRRQTAAAPARAPSLWARIAAQLAGYAEQRGADRGALLEAAGLPPAALADPDARVPLEAFYTLVEAAVAALADPHLGLGFAGRFQPEHLDALGFLAMSSPTLGEALRRMLRYQQLWNEGERYTLEIRGDRAHLGFAPFGPDRPAHGQMAEVFALDVLVNAGQMSGAPIEAIAVRFRHAPAGDPAEKERRIGSRLAFGAPATELVMPAEVLERPLPHANEALAAFLERQVGALAARLPGAAPAPPALAQRVRSLLGEQLREGADLPALAARLRMSPRTLQRRLRDEGTSLNALLDEVRRARAAALLEADMAIAEVAYLLGYSEPSAFHRAFRRWTGATPEGFRARAAEARAARPSGR
ncbi:AraC family transcriptional regulator [Sorangium cellulosum]|uniref:AraC family transcriptional regulator n=1 Tax=Sorangium cellulosum TaxID=56 RepID=A0A2L0F5E1_SORCE|nr:AraC family transcriptional regulator [Sorangium cellulosum]AUX46762.1 AraC family transcriptional regulator [Sorangium cellulosum]